MDEGPGERGVHGGATRDGGCHTTLRDEGRVNGIQGPPFTAPFILRFRSSHPRFEAGT